MKDRVLGLAGLVLCVVSIFGAIFESCRKASDCERRGGTLIQMKCLDIKELK